MTTAHLAGVPMEEWISPLILFGGGVVLATRAVVRRRWRGSARSTDV